MKKPFGMSSLEKRDRWPTLEKRLAAMSRDEIEGCLALISNWHNELAIYPGLTNKDIARAVCDEMERRGSRRAAA